MKTQLCIAFVILGCLFFPTFVFSETVMIPIHYRKAADVLPTVQTMLSATGEAVADKLTNSVIVTDDPETIRRIQSFMPEIDVFGKQVRVRVKFREFQRSSDSSVSVEGRIGDDDWEVSTGRKRKRGDGWSVSGRRKNRGRVGMNLDSGSRTERKSSESFITVVSGGSAYIAAGKDIPYRERWLTLTRRYARLADTVVFVRVATGFEVSPVVRGNIAHLTITPRMSYVDSRDEKGVIRFTDSQTSVSVPLGQWVGIGGTADAENEVFSAILEHGRGTKDTSLDISLLVE